MQARFEMIKCASHEITYSTYFGHSMSHAASPARPATLEADSRKEIHYLILFVLASHPALLCRLELSGVTASEHQTPSLTQIESTK